jgi:hypothetical protein
MAAQKKKAPAPVAATPAKSLKTIKRTRRNALERKCLSKTMKRLFIGADRTLFRLALDAEREARAKTA